MSSNEEHKIARIFGQHYGAEDGLAIEQCIRSIIQHGDLTSQERLVAVLEKNGWSAPDAQSFADAIAEMN